MTRFADRPVAGPLSHHCSRPYGGHSRQVAPPYNGFGVPDLPGLAPVDMTIGRFERQRALRMMSYRLE
ncbi:hypothetical protein CHELA1G11_13755 [Hyphomicrobiales bacterium]|nr:hypothetical protein CHELA1G2_10560 [Hyphomicrobiales bacterium]CAH1673814.1 hypothetical protein CHELA1G11_13755 [Hyphomicrobiales bacterium]